MKLPRNRFSIVAKVGVVCVAPAVGVFLYFLSTPPEFPTGTTFTISEDENLESISERLEEWHYIRSAFLFRMWVSFLGKDTQLQLGMYYFPKDLSLPGVVSKIAIERPDSPLLSVTIPEGSTTREVGLLLRQVLPQFNVETFLAKVKEADANGKLFPSTYHLLPSTTEEKAVELLTSTFEKKFMTAFPLSPYPSPLQNRDELIVLAAILEGEARTKEEMEIIAGILLKRLKMGMRLQVDVAMETYRKAGLPAEPINNPGLLALGAVLRPTPSPYLYYITGNDGVMYYAKTYEEHKKNIQKYLK